MRMRREQILNRLKNGGHIQSGIYSSDKYQVVGGTNWPADSRQNLMAIASCHKGDVERMIRTGELVCTPGHRPAYPNYVLPEQPAVAVA